VVREIHFKIKLSISAAPGISGKCLIKRKINGSQDLLIFKADFAKWKHKSREMLLRAKEFAELSSHINEVPQINTRHHWSCVNHHMVIPKRK
jgi:hypothetical protein